MSDAFYDLINFGMTGKSACHYFRDFFAKKTALVPFMSGSFCVRIVCSIHCKRWLPSGGLIHVVSFFRG